MKSSILGLNENMLAIDGSALKGMSGGPLVRVQKGKVEILGVLTSSYMLPFLRGIHDFIKGYLMKGWNGFSPI